MLCISQEFHIIYNPTIKEGKLKTHGASLEKSTFATKYEHPLWPQQDSTNIQEGVEL